MNSNFQVKTISKNNRGIFTKKNYNHWQKVMILQPICLVTLRNVKNTHCGYCLMQKQLFRCSKCQSFYYCSQKCQQADWPIHRLECKFYEKMIKNKNLSVLKQIVSQFILNLRLWLIVDKNPELSEQFYDMLSLQDYQTPERVQYFKELSVMLLENLGLEKNQANMSRIFKQVNIASINVFTVQQIVTINDGIALALYSPANYINHECQPNCCQFFDGRQLTIIAMNDIKQGQELTISYVQTIQTYDQRQNTLKNFYLFECFCELCQAQKMLNTSIYYLICPECKDNKLLCQQKNQKQNSSQRYYKCQSCSHNLFDEQIKALKDKIKKLSTNLGDTYKQSKKNFFHLKKLVKFQHPLFANAIEHLYRKAIDEMNLTELPQNKQSLLKEAYILLKQCLANLKIWYKVDNEKLVFLITYAEMSKLAYNLNKKKIAFEYSQKAYNLLMRINPKHKTKEVVEIMKRHEELKIQIGFSKCNLHKK